MFFYDKQSLSKERSVLASAHEICCHVIPDILPTLCTARNEECTIQLKLSTQTVQHKLVFAIRMMYGVHTKFFNWTMYVFVNKVTSEAIKGNIYIKKET